MELLPLYTSILKFSGLEPDDQGFISTILDERREPAVINGARMVLPTPNQLRNFNPKEKIIFHPLTENILRGESEVVTKLKLAINIKLNFSVGVIAQHLLNVVASPALHRKLNPEQAELLTSITDCDEKAVTNFITLMIKGVKANPDRLFANIYLKRGGTYHSKRYSRVGIVSFPFYQNLLDDKVEGIRVKDKATYKELFQFIFPAIEDPELYNHGSNSQVAPYLDSLLHTAAKVASRLNDVILTFKDYIDDADSIMFEADWMEDFANLEELIPEIRKIPVQFGNDGSIDAGDKQEPVPQVTQLAVVPQQPAYPQQYPQTMQPQQPVQNQPARPEVKHTKNGLDFKSVMQANPALQYAQNPMAPILANQQYMEMARMAQVRQPSWAQPQPNMYPPVQMQPGMYPPVQMQPGMYPQQVAPQGWPQPGQFQPQPMVPGGLYPPNMQPQFYPQPMQPMPQGGWPQQQQPQQFQQPGNYPAGWPGR